MQRGVGIKGSLYAIEPNLFSTDTALCGMDILFLKQKYKRKSEEQAQRPSNEQRKTLKKE